MNRKLSGILMVIIILMVLGLTWALFSKRIVNSSEIASYLDDAYSDTLPTKENAVFDYALCDNDAEVSWNDDVWALEVSNLQRKTRCNLYFSSLKEVTKPELYQGFIPVIYDDGKAIVADSNSDWYDYLNHQWANAVLVNCSDESVKNKYFDDNMNLRADVIGTTIDMNEILQMYVWIPRYKYKLWNAEDSTSEEQMINIVFESANHEKSHGTRNGEYLTHPAFTFGDTELSGFWVGKFETTGTTELTTIKPNLPSLTNIVVSKMFDISRSFSTSRSSMYGLNSKNVNSHMIKNSDWGAVAYLSNSRYGRYLDENTCIDTGRTPWKNNITSTSETSIINISTLGVTTTWCSGSSVMADSDINMLSCRAGYDWQTKGVNASTTGNIYGVYDMSGGSFEYTMGIMYASDNKNFDYSYSGFFDETFPERKYYETYSYQYSPSYVDEISFSRYKIGDGTKEILKNNKSYGMVGWYSTDAYGIYDGEAFIVRGMAYVNYANANIFSFSHASGGCTNAHGFRNVITKE